MPRLSAPRVAAYAARMTKPFRISIERGQRRTFATAIEWPGWSRSGTTDDDAIAALAATATRYARVMRRAGVAFPRGIEAGNFEIDATHGGGSGTDFGIPSIPPAEDDAPVTASDVRRLTKILSAAWAELDATAERHAGAILRKGPRGGGRPLTKIVGHVLESEEAYLHQLGSKRPKVAAGASVATRMAAVREAALAAFSARAKDEPLENPNAVRKAWTPRYFVRRSAWHALDHAWEIEDRASPAGA